MQVAADVRDVDERRRFGAERLLPQLGRAPRDPERAVDLELVRAIGQRLERLDVRQCAGRADEVRAGAGRRWHAQLDRDAFDGDADSAPVLPFDERHDLRQLLEAEHDLGGVLGRGDDREVLAPVPEPARVPGRLGAEGPGDLVRQGERAVQQERVSRRPRELLAQYLAQLLLRLRADPRHLP